MEQLQVNKEQQQVDLLLSILKVILDQVDYVAFNCKPNEMIGAILDRQIIIRARHIVELVEKK